MRIRSVILLGLSLVLSCVSQRRQTEEASHQAIMESDENNLPPRPQLQLTNIQGIVLVDNQQQGLNLSVGASLARTEKYIKDLLMRLRDLFQNKKSIPENKAAPLTAEVQKTTAHSSKTVPAKKFPTQAPPLPPYKVLEKDGGMVLEMGTEKTVSIRISRLHIDDITRKDSPHKSVGNMVIDRYQAHYPNEEGAAILLVGDITNPLPSRRFLQGKISDVTRAESKGYVEAKNPWAIIQPDTANPNILLVIKKKEDPAHPGHFLSPEDWEGYLR